MSYKIDLHIHTSVNPHAYSTLEENIAAAKRKGMQVIAITNHGPALPDTPHWWHLANIQVIPHKVDGLRILRGVEVNILGVDAEIDINQQMYEKMDIVLGGFHGIPTYGNTDDIEKNTRAVINLIESQKIDILVHPGNPACPIDFERVAKCAKENFVALELNNGSLTNSRKGSEELCPQVAEAAKKHGCYVSLGSDSHFSGDIGVFTECQKLAENVDYPEALIINSSEKVLNEFLKKRKELKPKEIFDKVVLAREIQ